MIVIVGLEFGDMRAQQGDDASARAVADALAFALAVRPFPTDGVTLLGLELFIERSGTHVDRLMEIIADFLEHVVGHAVPTQWADKGAGGGVWICGRGT
jgi:hypothetical protein